MGSEMCIRDRPTGSSSPGPATPLGSSPSGSASSGTAPRGGSAQGRGHGGRGGSSRSGSARGGSTSRGGRGSTDGRGSRGGRGPTPARPVTRSVAKQPNAKTIGEIRRLSYAFTVKGEFPDVAHWDGSFRFTEYAYAVGTSQPGVPRTIQEARAMPDARCCGVGSSCQPRNDES